MVAIIFNPSSFFVLNYTALRPKQLEIFSKKPK